MSITSFRKGDEGHATVLEERYDPDAMRALLCHEGLDSDIKERLKAMSKASTNGNCLAVKYFKNNKLGYGRLYADKGRSLQMLKADVRNALCGKLVFDVDMVNGHPTILMGLAKKHGWVRQNLQRLCCDREQVLQEVQEAYAMTRSEAKVAILKLLYLGGLPVDHHDDKALTGLTMGDIEGYQLPEPCQTPNTHTYLRDLKAELTVLAANITAMYPEHTKEAERQRKAKNKTTGHPLSTAVSLVVSDWENRMLLTAERQLRVMGRRVTTLIYDGLHVMRLEGEETLPASILKACEAAILQETDLAVQLVVKPMPTTMQLSAAEDQKGADPYTTCRLLLLKNAKARQLVRMWGELWEPVPGTVCAYRQAVECTAEQDPLRAYVNQVLENEPEYHLKNDTSDKCVKYLQQYAHPDCPFVPGPDRSLISFKNGVYILPEDRFVANDSSEAADMKASHRIARHHLETDFTGSIETPLFDKLVTYQVEDPEVYKWLLVLLGRLQYKVGELDNWQVMLYVYGLAGTGKSTALKIYSKAFRPGAVEYLSSNTEEQFGLQKLASTRVEAIMCLDVPSDLPTTKVLRQDLWQQLVGGEEVNVPRKNGLARSERILCPMAMAGNKFLDYKDSNGNVSRRVAALRYQRYLPADMQDGDIENTVVAQELPAIILRCNRMYLEQARGSGKRGIWDVLPAYYKEIKHTAAQSVNPLREFLSAPRPSGPCRDTRYFALYDRDAKTSHSDLTHALQAYMRLNYPSIKAPSRWSADEVNPLYEMGFERSKMAVCKACRQKHIKGCCEFYDARNKTTEITWLHLRLVTVEPHDDEAAIF